MTDPVAYKVVDTPWSPSDPATSQEMLTTIGQEGWVLSTVYPDPQRERTRWIFSSSPAAPGAGGIPEAPTDGGLYGRQNAAWSIITLTVGPAGPTGPAGPAGPQGLQGNAGPPGPTGPQGNTGSAGPQGQQGPQGNTGLTGAQGPQGVAGPAGPQGLQGAPGAQGAQGPAGPTQVSADPGNLAKLGTDNLVLVPDSAVHAGVTDGSNALAGKIGEQLSTQITTAVNLALGAAANIGQLVLTPGDWVVGGNVNFASPATAGTRYAVAISSTSGALPTPAQLATGIGTLFDMSLTYGKAAQNFNTSLCRFNVSTSTTIYLVALGPATTATGYISARRVR